MKYKEGVEIMSSSLVVNTQVGTQNTPAGIAENISSLYQAGQTITQTLLLQPSGSAGSQFSSPAGFSQITVNPQATVVLTAQKGSNPAYISLNVNQQTTIDDTVDTFQVTNPGTTQVAVNLIWIVQVSTSTPVTSVVTSVNGQTGAVVLTASSLSGLATVAQTGNYFNLINLPNLAAVATTGSYNSLTNLPVIPTAPVNADWNSSSGLSQILNKPQLAAVATTGSYSSLTGVPTLATVATTGSYNNLIDTPTLAPVATTGLYSSLTGAPVLALVATSGSYSDLDNIPAPYTLPTASPTVLGGVKVSTTSGLSVTSGSLSIAPATASVIGGVKQGTNVTIAGDGTLSVIGVSPISYAFADLPTGTINGSMIFVTNGRKVGEAAGHGTGVPAYWSTENWRVFSTDQPVQI